MQMSGDPRYALNAVCPYYTMFPLEFPLNLLRRQTGRVVLCDPFCGRGTSIFAARLRGFDSYGIDASPVAVAIAKAKLANTTKRRVMKLASALAEKTEPVDTPQGEFWERAYHPEVLATVVRLREGLLSRKESNSSVLLRAVCLGALHGPMSKSLDTAGYFSNQMPRTFASKPEYSAKFWRERRMTPPRVDVLGVIERRVDRLLQYPVPATVALNSISLGDSRSPDAFAGVPHSVSYIVSSPPYFGMTTYIQDQWLRNWFMGGTPEVPYSENSPFSHRSPEAFAESLALVWDRVGEVCTPDVQMAIRFGAIGSRKSNPSEIIRNSLEASRHPWHLVRSRPAGDANDGKRQATQMQTGDTAINERDYFIRLH